MPTTELLLLTGLPADDVERVIGRILELDPCVAVLHHDLRDLPDGVVHRRLRHLDRDERTVLDLAHGCVSCTLREDLLPGLRALGRPGGPARVVLHLDAVLEPEQVCFALDHVVVDPGAADDGTVTGLLDLCGVVTVVDVATWLDDATSDLTTAERGLAQPPGDERTIAQVAVAQVEFADLLVTAGAGDPWEIARTDAVLARLAPGAARMPLELLDDRVLLTGLPPTARRGVPDTVHGPLLRGEPPLEPDSGIGLAVFSARRPFHPQRLHEAIDVLLDGVVRSRGRVWLATRPDAVLWLESAGGGLQVGYAGDWLADADAAAWEDAGPDRRAMAALAWDPDFGDRAQDVVVITAGAGPDEIDEALRGALLTDEELVGGPATWAGLPDPFGWWHDDPCTDTADAGTGAPDTGETGRT